MNNLSSNKIALILCLEHNRQHQLYNTKILYEREAIQACLSWRKNAGWLKDIDIFGLCNCLDQIDVNIITTLKQLGVKIITLDNKFNDYALYNTVYAQYFFEKEYHNYYNYAIYIDLDFYLQKEIPIQLFQKKTVYLTYFNSYKIFNSNDARYLQYRCNNMSNINGKAFNTMIIVHYLKNKLCEKIYNTINDYEYYVFSKKYIMYDGCKYYLEEGLYDFLYVKNKINDKNSIILKLTYITSQYFKHYHLYANNLNFKQLLNYAKYN